MVARCAPILLVALLLVPACSGVKSGSAQTRIDQLETRLSTLGSEPKDDVLEEMSALGFGEPESVERTDDGGEVYLFQRKYAGQLMYDKVTLTFRNDRLAAYDASVVR